MITFRDIKKVAARVFRSLQPTLRTHLVGQVVAYDPATNTAEIQPVVNAVRFGDPDNLTTKQLPVLADVPVQLPGSGKVWVAFGLAEGTYGTLHVSDRELETWLTTGGIVDPGDIRMHDISDCWFEPSLVHLTEEDDAGAFAEAIDTDRICLRTRTNTTQIAVKDDETVEIKNENCTLTIDVDGNVALTTAGDVTMTADGNVTTDATETVIQAGADYAVQYTAMKSAFDTLKSELNALVTVYNTHVHPGVLAGAASTAVTPAVGTPPAADMSGAQISDVRLP